MKTAIVTGGCGILGQRFSKALHKAGWKVFILDIRKPKKKLSEGIKVLDTDITSRTDLESALSIIGPPDLLVNAGAIDVVPKNEQHGLLDTIEDEREYDKIMNTNIKGTILPSQIFGRAMKRGASIITISSIYGGAITPDQRIYPKGFMKPIAYCASKSAIIGVTKYLAESFAPRGIRVNCLVLGGVFSNQKPDFVKKYSEKVPLGRMARKDEYVEAILFLASKKNSYMIGSILTIDGGYTCV